MRGSRTNAAGFWLFLIGAFSVTQIGVIGYIGVSELIVFIMAPIVYLQDSSVLKYDGFSTYLCFVVLAMAGCLASGFVHHTHWIVIAKVGAMVYALFAHIVVLHRLLRNDPSKIKWMFLGVAISTVISIFIFQPGSAINAEGMTREELQEAVTGYSLFWVNLLNVWAYLPVQMFYLQIPFFISVLTPFAVACYAISATSSGRSTFLATMFAFALLIFGGKGKRGMDKIRKNFGVVFLALIFAGAFIGAAYKIGAKSGAFGVAMKEKYVTQSEGRKGIFGTLMGGRIETFKGFYVAIHHPILGIGPKGADREGLVDEFVRKYGTSDDEVAHARHMAFLAKKGAYISGVPAHSHIVAFWLWCGLPGLLFWLYALWLIFTTMKNYLSVIPHWFGYFALTIPPIVWGIFFSPFGNRMGVVLLLTCCLIARAVGKGKIILPPHMQREIREHQ